VEVETTAGDGFGAQPSDDDYQDNLDDDFEYNIPVKMLREVETFTEGGDCTQRTGMQQNGTQMQAGLSERSMMSFLTEFTDDVDAGVFDSNDPSFFDLERMRKFFRKVDIANITDDDTLMDIIQEYGF
jgi:hypothetical protein